MKIFHISDAHFGNENPAFDITKLENALLESSDFFSKDDTYMIVSGDITFQGRSSGYKQATKFFENTWLTHGGDKSRFLACPGNHDICNGNFESFDAFLYGIRKDSHLSFQHATSHVLHTGSISFLVLNSASHCDHEYGYIDFDYLSRLLKSESARISAAKQKIAVVHHNLIGIYKADKSSIRNALPLIGLLDEFGFNLLLHGHQHSNASLKIGNNLKISSARSLNFSTGGLVNGISELTLNHEEWITSLKVLSSDNSLSHNLTFQSTVTK